MSVDQRRKISDALSSKMLGEAPKKCPDCQETKPRDMFGRRSNGYSRSRCRPCEAERTRLWGKENPDKLKAINRATNLKRYYGITQAQYNSLLEAQGGACRICGSSEEAARGAPLVVDHCHDSMRIRGLLCTPCNQGIGFLRDDPAILRSALLYLQADGSDGDLVAVPGMPSGIKPRRQRVDTPPQ